MEWNGFWPPIALLSHIAHWVSQQTTIPAQADGILCPGGTFANVVALMIARHACFPHVKAEARPAAQDKHEGRALALACAPCTP